MTGVSLGPEGFRLELAPQEREILASLAGQMAEVLEEGSDPVRERMLPDAYPGDPEASAEFRRLTRSDLIERKRAGQEALARAAADAEGTLDREGAETVMRALADIRLVLADRMDISPENPDPGDDGFASLYEWLAYLQECLVEALVTHDEDSGRLDAP